jgi:hypothetical protein
MLLPLPVTPAGEGQGFAKRLYLVACEVIAAGAGGKVTWMLSPPSGRGRR